MELAHIKNRIHEVRGMKIMLDFDLAQLYTIETKRLKEAVRRNIRRFPEDFMFELTSNEWENLRTQIASSSWGGKRHLPFAFTEQGIAMLSSVLHSDVAIEINISIMRAFVHMRQWGPIARGTCGAIARIRNALRQKICGHRTGIDVFNAKGSKKGESVEPFKNRL